MAMVKAAKIWYNGEFVNWEDAKIHVLSHVVHYGTSFFEGARCYKTLKGSACFRIHDHMRRLVESMKIYRTESPYTIDELVEAALEKYDLYRKLFDNELPALATYDTALAEKDFRIFDTSIPWPAGKPGFKDMNDISTRGDMKPYNVPLEEGWFIPTKIVPKSTTGTGTQSTQGAHSGTQSASRTEVKTTKAGSGTAVKAIPATAAKKVEDDTSMVVVEVEIGSEEEAEQAAERAKSMGMCTHFDNDADVATTIGLTQAEVAKLTNVELANLLGRTHFNFGYAVSRFDTKAEIGETRKKGRGLTKRLERAEEKKTRSQNLIWELKQIITLMLSLNDSGYPVTSANIDRSLSAFSTLSESRKKDISNQAKSILQDRNVQKVMRDLRKEYQKAKLRKQRRAERTSTAKE